MGLFSWFSRKEGRPTPAQEYQPSLALANALEEALKRPLNDLTSRIVVAAPQRHFILDVTIFEIDNAFNVYEKGGRQARRAATEFLAEAIQNGGAPPEQVAVAALGFFDREYTKGANAGCTAETAWNTLTLDIVIDGRQFGATRGTCRLEYPDGPIDLSFNGFERLLRGGR
jgi:hypothetical protein